MHSPPLGRPLSNTDLVLHELWPLAPRRSRVLGLMVAVTIGLILGAVVLIPIGFTLYIIGVGSAVLGGMLVFLKFWNNLWPEPAHLKFSRIKTSASLKHLIRQLAFGLAAGLAFGLIAGITGGFTSRLVFGLTGGLAFGLAGGPAGVRYIGLLLATRRQLPWFLGRFLDTCYQLGLLRTSGIAYQFRHRELQDHLAAARPSNAQISGSTSVPIRAWDLTHKK